MFFRHRDLAVALKESRGKLQWRPYWTCSVSQCQKQSCLNPPSLQYFCLLLWYTKLLRKNGVAEVRSKIIRMVKTCYLSQNNVLTAVIKGVC